MKTMLIIVIVLIIAMTAYYFTQTKDGLITRIMYKYPSHDGNTQKYKDELSGLTIQELKDIFKYGGQ